MAGAARKGTTPAMECYFASHSSQVPTMLPPAAEQSAVRYQDMNRLN